LTRSNAIEFRRLVPDAEDRASQNAGSTYLEWFEPTDMDVAVILLPTPHGWHAPAYLSFFGAEGPGGAEKLVAILRLWHDRHGAELLAHYGTMLEFVVDRPPQTIDEAWQLAREQVLIAPCTTAPRGVPLRQHARALIGRSTWFLHERPRTPALRRCRHADRGCDWWARTPTSQW
jgi:hypothetical protein